MLRLAAAVHALLESVTLSMWADGLDALTGCADAGSAGQDRLESAGAAASALNAMPDPPGESVQPCGEECLNRLSYIRCDSRLCPCGAACSNRLVVHM